MWGKGYKIDSNTGGGCSCNSHQFVYSVKYAWVCNGSWHLKGILRPVVQSFGDHLEEGVFAV